MAERSGRADAAAAAVREGRMTQQQAAIAYGVAPSTVSRRLRPEVSSAQERARRDAKNEWARAHAYDRCPGCGDAKRRSSAFCRACSFGVMRGRADEVVDLYRAGLPPSEIASRTGRSRSAISATLKRRRAEGYDLPYQQQLTPEAIQARADGGRKGLASRLARRTPDAGPQVARRGNIVA
jgi:IS30 family transposase